VAGALNTLERRMLLMQAALATVDSFYSDMQK
jgi:hypothetical protein